MPRYDIVIIGSGLGGLLCGYILSQEGFSVCILEKHSHPGGCLQNFTRNGHIFDTGIHYIGSLDEGQILNRYFRYFGLMDKLPFKRLDSNSFDKISFASSDKEYSYAMGVENFIETLAKEFPGERNAIVQYINKMKEISHYFPLYNLSDQRTDISETAFYGENAVDYISSLTKNQTLRSVLAGTNPLYAGIKEKTPFYVHALVNYSFIESSYRIMDGSSQIATLLCNSITANGGKIMTRCEAKSFRFEGSNIKYIELANGELIEGTNIISNIHPANTLAMIPEGYVRKAYRNRIYSLENTTSSFSVYCSFKKNSIPYMNYNLYHYENENVWNAADYDVDKWPQNFLLLTPASKNSDKYSDSIVIMGYMKYSEVKKWENTTIEKRGQDYIDFKREKAEKLIDLVNKKIPGFKDKITGFYTSTPLTYRDYTGTPEGSLYGILKDCNEPLRAVISPRTKIPNLLFTGQNVILHGVLGVTIGAVTTCSELIGLSYLVNKIKSAS